MRLQYGFHFQRMWIFLSLNCKFLAILRNSAQIRAAEFRLEVLDFRDTFLV